jgi:Methyltransferase domain
MSIAEQRDWHAWHNDYDDDGSDLSRRLKVVQAEIRKVLPLEPTDEFSVVSICAGQAHDIIGVLSHYPHADKVRARLVELNPHNVEQIRAKVAAAGLNVDVVEGDAADTSLYEGAAPADLVLAVGIFGNVSDADVLTTIRALPQFCKPGATVLWSRGRHLRPDITAQIRSTFADAGFVETAFHAPPDARFQIGADRYQGPAQALQREHLFTFLK